MEVLSDSAGQPRSTDQECLSIEMTVTIFHLQCMILSAVPDGMMSTLFRGQMLLSDSWTQKRSLIVNVAWAKPNLQAIQGTVWCAKIRTSTDTGIRASGI